MQPYTSKLVCSNIGNFKYVWTWDKAAVTGFLNAKKQPLRVTEDICVFYRRQCTYNPQMVPGKHRRGGGPSNSPNYRFYQDIPPRIADSYYPRNLLRFSKGAKNGGDGGGIHPTWKPVGLLRYLIRTYTNEGETVLDPFAGCGNAMVAALSENRSVIGFETETEYYLQAKRRLDEALAEGGSAAETAELASHAPELPVLDGGVCGKG